jgi:hypothetical protein
VPFDKRTAGRQRVKPWNWPALAQESLPFREMSRGTCIDSAWRYGIHL